MRLHELMQVAMEAGMQAVREDLDGKPFALSAKFLGDEVHRIEFTAPTKALARTELTAILGARGDFCCVLVMSTWITASVPTSPQHAYYLERIQRGKMSLGDLPPELRQEVLYLVGEDTNANIADRAWKVFRDDGVRFELMNDDQFHMATPWRPMFLGMLRRKGYC